MPELLAKAEEVLERGEPELALKFYNRCGPVRGSTQAGAPPLASSHRRKHPAANDQQTQQLLAMHGRHGGRSEGGGGIPAAALFGVGMLLLMLIGMAASHLNLRIFKPGVRGAGDGCSAQQLLLALLL